MRRPTTAALLRVRNLVVLSNLNVNSLSTAAPSQAVVVIVLLENQGLGSGGVRVSNRVRVALVVDGFRVGLRWVVWKSSIRISWISLETFGVARVGKEWVMGDGRRGWRG
ncbi:hypothetical protein C1H46_012086 [Malus baccata]|uniref:Uncharacterized protein n=1 Tax=Malus baccata TaxID=106549 RepID=A0A540MU38_MALBA|nr:hypothetical protein C1H46_012086 [Malus baccata]